LSGEIAKRHGNLGMSSAPINFRLTGVAGQSLGVWNAGGLNIYLEGDANDYVGKGMAGGKIVIRRRAASYMRLVKLVSAVASVTRVRTRLLKVLAITAANT